MPALRFARLLRRLSCKQTTAFFAAVGIREPLRVQAQELRASTQSLFDHTWNPAKDTRRPVAWFLENNSGGWNGYPVTVSGRKGP
jgi:hypothetical protein